MALSSTTVGSVPVILNDDANNTFAIDYSGDIASIANSVITIATNSSSILAELQTLNTNLDSLTTKIDTLNSHLNVLQSTVDNVDSFCNGSGPHVRVGGASECREINQFVSESIEKLQNEQ